MILKRHVLTEKIFKSNNKGDNNKYCFFVDSGVNKIIVRREIESKFNVLVEKVNVLINSKKNKKISSGKKMYKKVKGGEKKAFVTLKKGFSINFEA